MLAYLSFGLNSLDNLTLIKLFQKILNEIIHLKTDKMFRLLDYKMEIITVLASFKKISNYFIFKQGSVDNDMCSSFCCPCCTLIQINSKKKISFNYQINLQREICGKEISVLSQKKTVKSQKKIFYQSCQIKVEKKWCTCSTMADKGICEHLVRVAIIVDFPLIGLETKTQR